jgi:hypothetical protein
VSGRWWPPLVALRAAVRVLGGAGGPAARPGVQAAGWRLLALEAEQVAQQAGAQAQRLREEAAGRGGQATVYAAWVVEGPGASGTVRRWWHAGAMELADLLQARRLDEEARDDDLYCALQAQHGLLQLVEPDAAGREVTVPVGPDVYRLVAQEPGWVRPAGPV